MMTRRFLFQVGLPSIGFVLWGCGSATETPSAGFVPNPPTNTTPVAVQVLRSERDSSFFVDSSGNLFQVNQRSAEVQKFAPNGQRIWVRVLKGRGPNQMDTPVAGAVDGQGRAWLVDRALSRLQILDGTGQPVGNVVSPDPMLRPQDVALDGQRVYVSDGYEHRVLVFDLNGQFLQSWTVGGDLNYPRGLALDSSGRLHLADAGNARILILNSTGQLERSYGSPSLRHPRGLSIAPGGVIAVADSVLGLIQLFSPELTLIASLRPTSGGQLLTPLDLQFGPGGVLYLTAEPADVV